MEKGLVRYMVFDEASPNLQDDRQVCGRGGSCQHLQLRLLDRINCGCDSGMGGCERQRGIESDIGERG